jgi:hypothetical protein
MRRQLSLYESRSVTTFRANSGKAGLALRVGQGCTSQPYTTCSSFHEDLTEYGQLRISQGPGEGQSWIAGNGLMLGADLILPCSHSISSRSNYLVFSPPFLRASPSLSTLLGL